MLNDPIANALSKINNAEKRSKKECSINPTSKIIETILTIMKTQGYVGETKKDEDQKSLNVELIGIINKCGAIKPKHSVSYNELEKYEKRYLAAKDFGIIILTTSKGVLTHLEAKEQKIGGKLLAYCY